MSRLFSNFAVRIEVSFSPTATRISGHNMLHAEFHVFNLYDVIGMRQNIVDILGENLRNNYKLNDYGLTLVLEIPDLYSYSLANYLIEQIEKSRVNHRIACILTSLEYKS